MFVAHSPQMIVCIRMLPNAKVCTECYHNDIEHS